MRDMERPGFAAPAAEVESPPRATDKATVANGADIERDLDVAEVATVANSTGIYAGHARDYYAAGWPPLPIPPRSKGDPPAGYTGHDGADPSGADVEAWCEDKPDGNIALRMPKGVIGIDVDVHKGPAELLAWADLLGSCGQLPDGPRCTSRTDGVSGIRPFRVPDHYVAAGTLPGGCGDVIQRHHRYAVAPPSIHRDTGAVYQWADGQIPKVADLPWLPLAWQQALAARPAAAADTTTGSLFQSVSLEPDHAGGWSAPDIGQLVTRGIESGNQHDRLRDTVARLNSLGLTRAEVEGIWWAIVSKTPATRPGEPWTQRDLDRMLDSAVAKYGQGSQRAVLTVAEPDPGAFELDEFLAQPEPEYDWLIPGLIERHDRTIVTAAEGTGKSTFLRQLGVQCASGIHPFGGHSFDPFGVLYVDLENPAALIRRKLRPLRLTAGDRYQGGFKIRPRPDGIDLLNVGDAQWLHGQVGRAAPGILIIGPVYKMHTGSAIDEEPARQAAHVLDQIRTTYGVALLMEAHTPYPQGKAPRPMRPYGASLRSRWPEFGIHISKEGPVSHWRGPRDERDWPKVLRQGGEWPWTASDRGRDVHWARIVQHCTDHGQQLPQRELAKLLDTSAATINRVIGEHRAEWDRMAGEPQ